MFRLRDLASVAAEVAVSMIVWLVCAVRADKKAQKAKQDKEEQRRLVSPTVSLPLSAYCKTLIVHVRLIFTSSIKSWNHQHLQKFGFTVAFCGCFSCNLAAEYSSVGNTSPGSC